MSLDFSHKKHNKNISIELKENTVINNSINNPNDEDIFVSKSTI